MKSINIFNYSDLSLYRNPLMGIGILGVLIAHALNWMGIDNGILYRILNIFSRLVFVEGFLFLSGFGIYYSLAKSNKSFAFIKKRFWRVLFPFMLITFPLYLVTDIYIKKSIGNFILDITSLSFWFYGNNGMWYISISIILYLISPLIFKITQSKCPKSSLIILIITYIIICELLHTFLYQYYVLISISILKVPMFILGMYWGFCSWSNKSFKNQHWFIIIGGLIFLALMKKAMPSYISTTFIAYYESLFRLFCMMLLCFFFNKIRKDFLQRIECFLGWFGKYTLELYILHMSLYITYRLFFPDSEGLSKQIAICSILIVSIILCHPVKKIILSISCK